MRTIPDWLGLLLFVGVLWVAVHAVLFVLALIAARQQGMSLRFISKGFLLGLFGIEYEPRTADDLWSDARPDHPMPPRGVKPMAYRLGLVLYWLGVVAAIGIGLVFVSAGVMGASDVIEGLLTIGVGAALALGCYVVAMLVCYVLTGRARPR